MNKPNLRAYTLCAILGFSSIGCVSRSDYLAQQQQIDKLRIENAELRGKLAEMDNLYGNWCESLAEYSASVDKSSKDRDTSLREEFRHSVYSIFDMLTNRSKPKIIPKSPEQSRREL